MTTPLVSVIIPCYQAAKTLRLTLEDIFSQTHPAIEVIAIDDGSTDNTSAILAEYKNRIRIIQQSNKGAPTARNRGFSASKGDFILFCDADVRLEPTMISKLLGTLLEHPNKAYSYCNFKFGLHTFDLFPFNGKRLLRENYISTMSLIRREKFIGFDESLRRYQDWDLWKRLYRQGDEGVWCSERLFRVPMSGGISHYSLVNFLKIIWRKLFNII